MTVTRCDVSGSPSHAGISIQNSTQTAVLDNNCHNNSVGIYLVVRLGGRREQHLREQFHRHSNRRRQRQCRGQQHLQQQRHGHFGGRVEQHDCFVRRSEIIRRRESIQAAAATLFRTICLHRGNAANFISGGSGNNVIAYKTNLTASGQNYFYPPLIDDQHTKQRLSTAWAGRI